MSGQIQGCDDCHGTIEIAGVPGSDPDGRWCIYDLSPLLTDEEVRGNDRIMPLVPGRRPKPRRYDTTRYLLPIVFTGWTDDLGQPVARADAPGRLVSTMAEFQMALGIGPNRAAPTGDGTVTASWVLPDGQEWTTDLHVLRLRARRTAWGLWDGDLELSLPLPWQAAS